MADVWTAEKRSAVMSLIRSSGNKTTELRFIRLLRKHKVTGWRRRRNLLGRPDFVFPKQRVVVFVDGCFWHCCPRHHREPTSRVEYWRAKFARNRARDIEVTAVLRRKGWSVIRCWEHELEEDASSARLILRLRRALGQQKATGAPRR